jgi:isopropylmalate/homocitrate/citramalate synthase
VTVVLSPEDRGAPPFRRQVDSLAAGNTLVRHYEDRIAHPLDVHDDSLRDGEQTVGVAFSVEQKIEIARGLLEAGVRYLSLGYPAVSEAEREAIRAVASVGDRSGFSCLSRATRQDIEAVVACEIPNVALFIGVSDVHLVHKLRLTEEQAYEQMCQQVRLARSYGLNPRFVLEDATRTPLERLKRFAEGALASGATLLTIPDTCGVLTPLTAHRLITDLTAVVGEGRLVAHFHNDLGMATANSLAACAAGARFVQGTLSGIGERAGNTNLEQIVVALKVKYGVELGVNLPKLAALSQKMARWVRFPVPPNQPLSGEFAFSHESGIHVHGLMQEAACYEPFPPELIGRAHQVRYGKHSGTSNLRYLARLLGVEVADQTLAGLLAVVKARAEQGRPVEQGEVEEMLREASRALGQETNR